MWYKPSTAHQTLYPTKKDADGVPVKQMVSTAGGGTEERYVTCPHGIEVFRNKAGPTGTPLLAEFGATKEGAPLLNKEATCAAILKLLDLHPASFQRIKPIAQLRAGWQQWAAEQPAKATDLPEARRARWELPAKVGVATVPLPLDLVQQERRFAESIKYINRVSGHELSKEALAQIRDEEDKELQLLRKDELAFVDEGKLMYLCQICVDEVMPPAGETITDDSEVKVQWYGCFQSCFQRLVRKGSKRLSYHPYDRIRCETKEAKKENHGKFVDHIKRGSLLLRNVQLTQHGHLSARGKINTKLDVYKIARKKGLVSDGPSSIVPSSWGDMDIGRKQGRGVKRQ